MKPPFLASAAFVCLILLGTFRRTQAGQYFQTFDAFAEGTTNLGAAGELFSNQLGTTTRVFDASVRELQLTADGTGSTNAAFRLPDFDGGSAVTAFSAKWNSQIFGSTSAGLADGLSLNFGPLGDLNATALTTGFANEAGFGKGLTVSVVTYDGNTPGYYVRVDGRVVPGGFAAKAGSAWGSFNATRHFFEVDWHYFDGLTLRVDGTAIFTNLPTAGFVPDAGHRFVFGARTGGLDQEVRLDNIVIITGGVLAPLAAGSPYYFNSENLPNEGAAKAFDNNSATKWLATTPTATLGASLSAAKTIRAFTLTSANDVPTRDPKSWAFETGDNGTSWTGRGTQSTQYFLNRFEKRAFAVAAPAANSKFRLNITANNGSVETQLADLQAWELVPGPAFFKVFSTADFGADSLRTALNTAMGNAGQAVITFSGTMAGGTITPGSEFVINDSSGVAIDASNLPGGVILSGGNARRIASNSGTGPVKFSGITFTGGNGTSTDQSTNGGAFFGKSGSNTDFIRCTFRGNTGQQGGAVLNLGTMNLADCTFSGNNATSQGGGIQNQGILTMSRCTLSENQASVYGGAIENQNQLTLTHCTISGNTAGSDGAGVDNFHGTLNITNCIIAGNKVNGAGDDISNDATEGPAMLNRTGANIVQVLKVYGSPGESGPAAINADPLLAPLGDYGGFTKTMALKPGSPARNAASAGAATDQRAFPMVGAPDIGAYEAGTLTTFDNWIWESLPASATAAQHGLTVDFDGDRFTNEQEWLVLTNPANGADFLRLTPVSFDGTTFRVSFPTLAARTYNVEYSFDLIAWTSLGDAAGTGNNFVVSIGPLTGLKKIAARLKVRR